MLKLKDILKADEKVVDYPLIEVRTIYTDGHGLREDAYFGSCSFVGGELVDIDSGVSLEDEFDGWTTWSDGLDFNGVPVSMTVWKVVKTE